MTRRQGIVDTRSELLSLLSQACELEHALACAYLYAAFSLKQEVDEGLTFSEQQRTRRWAAQVYFVASQEMLHLAQAWDLLTAIGGTPYYGRPAFPVSMRYYPLGLELPLESFGVDTLRRFVRFEEPESKQREAVKRLEGAGVPDESFWFRTVGELYSLIESGFDSLCERELFLGAARDQATPTFVHFPDIVAVVDRASAKRAIAGIREQGEGTLSDREDSHFGIFTQILDEWMALNPAPGRLVRPSPSGGDHRPEATLREIEDLFDNLYVWMLQVLGYGFAAGPATTETRTTVCGAAIELMVRILKPLGDLVARSGGATRFEIRRHVHFPTVGRAATVLATTRLAELARSSEELAKRTDEPELARIGQALTELALRVAGP